MAEVRGATLGPYRILAEIGRGGMAVVYQAYDTRAARLVALKVLSPHLWQDREAAERFRREARNAATLQHPNIVAIYESGVIQGCPFLAMAYVEGGSLAYWLDWQRGPLPFDRVASVLDQVAAGLDYAHSRGLVHRDVKPSNILLMPDGRALLTDFGIAKAAWDSRLTRGDTRLGTAAYMAPEQARGQPVGRHTDVYALGVVLYEMVTGRPPFEGNTDAILYQHVHEPPPPPRALNPGLSPAAERVILRALAKDPAQRYRTAGELARAFRGAMGPAKPGWPTPPPPPTPVGSRSPRTPQWPAGGIQDLVALFVILTLVIVLIL